MNPSPLTVEAQLAVIETKIDLILATRDDHESRIRGLEQREPEDLGRRLAELENRSHQGIGRQSLLTVVLTLIPTALWLYTLLR